jgi:hypothetical protein
LPGIPGNQKNAAGDKNAEYLDKAVKKKVAVKAGKIKTDKN